MDRSGKDSARATAAGAVGVAVTGPGGFALLEGGEPPDPRRVVERFFADRDAVVLEGFREAGFPAVVLAGDGPVAAAVADARGPVLAIVARRPSFAGPPPVRPPAYEPDDFEGLASCLERAGGAVFASLRPRPSALARS